MLVFNLIFSQSGFGQVNQNSQWISGYHRADGIYVQGYYRTVPNSTINDNYSTYPNVNPYTGKKGYIKPKTNNNPVDYPDYAAIAYKKLGLDKLEKEKEALQKERKRVSKLTPEEERREALDKEKAQATKDNKPWVAVLDTQVNADNIKNGFFELDWNNEFIEQLLDAGYKGESNEEIVDQWFKTIVTQMLQEDGQDADRGMGYVNVVPIDKGKSEVS